MCCVCRVGKLVELVQSLISIQLELGPQYIPHESSTGLETVVKDVEVITTMKRRRETVTAPPPIVTKLLLVDSFFFNTAKSGMNIEILSCCKPSI